MVTPPPPTAPPPAHRQGGEHDLLTRLAAAGGDWGAAEPALAGLSRCAVSEPGRSELCRLVLEQQLWFYPAGPQDRRGEHDQLADAAWLFEWAVRPQVRDPAQEAALSGFLHLLAARAGTVERELLHRTVLAHPDPPDLPPRVWCRLVGDLAARPPTPEPVPIAPDPDPDSDTLWVDADWRDIPPAAAAPHPPAQPLVVPAPAPAPAPSSAPAPAPAPAPVEKPFAHPGGQPPQGRLIAAVAAAVVLLVVAGAALLSALMR